MKVVIDITPQVTDLFDCPNCGANIYKHITGPKNIVGKSEKYDRWDVQGFERVRDYYYNCPNCGERVYWTAK